MVAAPDRRWFRARSLQTRVTLLALAFIAATAWSITWWASRSLHHDIERQISDHQSTTVSLLAADVDQALDDRLRALQTVAAKITPPMLADSAAVQRFLEQRLTLLGLFNAGFFVTREDGTVIANAPDPGTRQGMNVAERDYMVAALQHGRASIGRPVLGKSLNSPVLTFGAPIRDAQGRPIGALVAVVDLHQPNFLDRITNAPSGMTADFMLVAPGTRLVVTASD